MTNFSLSPHVMYALIGAVALLIVASVIVRVLERIHRERDYTELRLRIRTWWLIVVYAFLFFPMRMVLVGETQGFLRAASTLQWGLMTTVFSLSHMAYLLALPDDRNPAGGGDALLFLLVFLTQINDVAQYVWSKSFGRHKVTPTVSPN